jgi:hypothetical protein
MKMVRWFVSSRMAYKYRHISPADRVQMARDIRDGRITNITIDPVYVPKSYMMPRKVTFGYLFVDISSRIITGLLLFFCAFIPIFCNTMFWEFWFLLLYPSLRDRLVGIFLVIINPSSRDQFIDSLKESLYPWTLPYLSKESIRRLDALELQRFNKKINKLNKQHRRICKLKLSKINIT